MAIKGAFLIGLMGLLAVAALVYPFAGVAAYLIHYHVFPEGSWWGASLSAAGVRYSTTIAAFLMLGTLLNWGKLPYRKLFSSQEVLFVCFLAWLVISRVLTGGSAEATGVTTDPVEKMLKMAVFLFILTHVVVTEKEFNQLSYVFIACAVYIGYEAFTAPPGAFYQGRLESYVGGPDFAESNMLAAHCLVLATIIAVGFLRGRSRSEQFLCLVAGALIGNTIIQTRSRSGLLGLAFGLVFALVLAPREKRKWIWAGALVGCIGMVALMDKGFLERMGTLQTAAEEDNSARLRLEMWRIATKMIANHPLGVGPGNFREHVPEVQGMKRDTHNTYLRCGAELGLPGLFLFLLIIGNGFRILAKTMRSCRGQPQLEGCRWHAYTFLVALVAYLVAGFFGSFNYHETLWMLLLLPAALERAVQNAAEAAATSAVAGSPELVAAADTAPGAAEAEGHAYPALVGGAWEGGRYE